MKAHRSLTVVADDFGMMPTVNAGILQAFTDGIVTDVNVMTCCPSRDEALQLIGEVSIPAGLHLTFTSEWDVLRWGPCTSVPSMMDSTGCFHPEVEEAWDSADLESALREAHAQLAVLRDVCRVTHIGEHMGLDRSGKFRHVLRELVKSSGVPHKGNWRSYRGEGLLHRAFDTAFSTSGRFGEVEQGVEWLIARFRSLPDGRHLLVMHPGVRAAAQTVCTPACRSFLWDSLYREIDLAIAVDERVADALDSEGISMVPISDVVVSRGL